MLDIYNFNEYEKLARHVILGVFSHFKINFNDVDLEVGLVSDEEIRDLNRDNRNIDAVTDVLSFPSIDITLPFNRSDYKLDVNPETGGVILGSIYISEAQAIRQAEENGHSLSRELAFLVMHGLLHILGYDHISDEDREKMEDKQNQILNELGITRDKANLDILNSINESKFKSGFIAVLGRPNAGKSTLINKLVGQKVSITSWKPQTTRNKILGIRNDEDSQIIFVDTPGLHAPKNELGRFMMRSVTAALNEVDAILYLTNAEKEFNHHDKENVERYIDAGKAVIVIVNKIDRVTPAKVGSILQEISKIKEVSAVVPISALRGKNLDAVMLEVKKLLPTGEAIFPDDIYTDRGMNFITSETIREKALKNLDEEIPYGIAVKVNKYDVTDELIEIDAEIVVQKASHKGIVLGKNGEMIKKIGTEARIELEKITGTKVFLTLWVRVEKDWRDDGRILERLGYNKEDYRN
ncbi:MAG TPA: GTPase Era [Clostridia bacterium]|jgi:GTP-binding protein Era/rRNA maturation RNase YbeY|nr:GTPase Era [Clostridia bacterium]